jgi:hypothetical protein
MGGDTDLLMLDLRHALNVAGLRGMCPWIAKNSFYTCASLKCWETRAASYDAVRDKSPRTQCRPQLLKLTDR